MKLIILIILSLIFIGCNKKSKALAPINCHFIYGGTQEDFKVYPTPIYEAKSFRFHAYYRLKMELVDYKSYATLKVYAWAPYKDQDKLLHMGVYGINTNAGKRVYTGKQFVYEPDAETGLTYWCD